MDWRSLIYSKHLDGDGNYIYNVEYKIFDKYMDSEWKGEFYRGEKTIFFSDSDIMMKISMIVQLIDGYINFQRMIKNEKMFSKTWNTDGFTKGINQKVYR